MLVRFEGKVVYSCGVTGNTVEPEIRSNQNDVYSSVFTMLLLLAIAIVGCHALTQQESSLWHPLPHFARREILLGGAATLATATTTKLPAAGATELATSASRSIFSIDSNLAIPVWPSWGGGRVVSETH